MFGFWVEKMKESGEGKDKGPGHGLILALLKSHFVFGVHSMTNDYNQHDAIRSKEKSRELK